MHPSAYFFALLLPTLLLNFLGSFRDMRVLSRVPVHAATLVTFLSLDKKIAGGDKDAELGLDVLIVIIKKVRLVPYPKNGGSIDVDPSTRPFQE